METDPGVVHWHIRSLAEFENFLRAPSEDKIMRLAEKGTIIIFNVSDIRSDAFDVTKKGIRLVPLPSLKLDCLNEHAERFWRAIEETDLNELRESEGPSQTPQTSHTCLRAIPPLHATSWMNR